MKTENKTTVSNPESQPSEAKVKTSKKIASSAAKVGGAKAKEAKASKKATETKRNENGAQAAVDENETAELVETIVESGENVTAEPPVDEIRKLNPEEQAILEKCDKAIRETKLNPDGTTTGEWEQDFADAVGRQVTHVYADENEETTTYNSLGQMAEQEDADGVITLYAYNTKGEQDTTAKHADSGLGSTIQYSGTDRITKTIRDVLFDSGVGTCVQRSRTYVWSTLNVDVSNLVSTTEVSTNGLNRWQITWNGGVGVTNYTVTSYAGSGYRYESSYAPDGSYTYRTYQYGQLLSEAKKGASGQTITQTSYVYDLFDRVYSTTDLRNGATTYAYDLLGQVTNTTTPAPGWGGSAQTTLTTYDSMQRPYTIVNPDGTSTFTTYWPTGEVLQRWGSRTYPVGYGYDYAGRLQTMTNWTDFASNTGARVTTWAYDGLRGWLTSKSYADGKGPIYSYTDAGRLSTRLWARGTNTTYTYNPAGDLATVLYNDGETAGITNGYDRLGRQTVVSNCPTVTTFTFNGAGQKLSESYAGGPLDGISITNGYDSLLRRTNVVTLNSGVLASTTYGYDGISRLLTVSDGTNSATYAYLTNSPLVSQITFAQSGTTRMTTTKQYDNLNRLISISSANASSVVLDSHYYAYNTANQRTSVTNVDGSRWGYFYDGLGQVMAGSNFWSDGTIVAGRQFNYAFDDIGNRTSTSFGGDTNGNNLRSATYAANNLNQYTNRTVPGYLEVEGAATNTATVTVNGQSTSRKNNYYWAELTVTNGSAAVLQEVTNKAVLAPGPNGTITGSTFVPQTPENFTYDADGNLTQDGRWTYVWDAENRLVNMTSLTNGPAGSLLRLDFAYDYNGRRVQKMVSTNTTGLYFSQFTNTFTYDDWNLVAVLNPDSAVTESFVWGADLSGSMQGVGGIGGLLKLSYKGTNCFVAFDGNGNISTLANAVSGTTAAQYEYGPFGEVVRATGLMYEANPIQFSTKYLDDETHFLYFGYRYLSTSTGRWLSRDLVGEVQGTGLYDFVRGDALDFTDMLGLYLITSEGYAFRDPWYGSIWSQNVSGAGSTAAAFYNGFASPWLTSICNSGDFSGILGEGPKYPPYATSFVKAVLFNDEENPITLRITCTAHLHAFVFGRAVLADPNYKPVGQILGEGPQVNLMLSMGTHGGAAWFTSYSMSATKTITLGAHCKYILYDLHMPVAAQVQPHFSGGFAEHGDADCTIQQITTQ